ncbi:hypothetical protein G4923_10640 [Aeromonas rivipollensis]|uniref:Lipoprotein n=1 Tax=Aeromonas rivipollensis TaxID=948519 RepID=A0ABX0CYW8_9GAMM|nr:hypothetical protein [Aeromonas rivipollensis]NEX89161.1 hypothetical protein [Aeromonas rivipollensis]NEY05027.1 hypothetical protein [Aeromonas rivipollensis]
MFKRNSIISALASMFLLSACDSGGIEKVKGTVNYDIDSSLTTGKAFETRSDCKNGAWSESKDNRDRIIVSYTCNLSDEGLSIINNGISERFIQSVDRMNGYINNKTASIDREIKEKSDEMASLEKGSEFIYKYVNDLHQSFLSNKVHPELNYRGYLTDLLEVTRRGQDPINVDSLCQPSSKNTKNPIDVINAGEAYQAEMVESCVKVISPIFLAFYKDYQSLEVSLNYDLVRTLINISSADWTADDNVSTEFHATIDEYKNSLNKRLSFLPNEKKQLSDSLADNLTLQKSALPELVINKFVIDQHWVVSDTGGVEILDGGFTINTSSGEAKSTIPGGALLPFAYNDFKSNEIPRAYNVKANAMISDVYNGFSSQIKTI